MFIYVPRLTLRHLRHFRHFFIPLLIATVTAASHSARAQNGDKSDAITQEDCTEFANRWISTIQSRDLDACRRLYDSDAFVDAMLDGLDLRYADRDRVAKQWKLDLANSQALYAPLAASLAGGSIQLLDVHPENATRNVVIRMIQADGSLNYVFLSLRKAASRDLAVVDCEYATSGGSLRDMLGMLIAHFAPYEGVDGRIVKSAPNADRLIYDKRVLASMQSYAKQRKPMEVVQLYEQLSPELQAERFPLLLTIGAAIAKYSEAHQAGENEIAGTYHRTLIQLCQRYRMQFPGDATVDLLLIDVYAQTQEFDSALESIDVVEQWVGGDPYLDTVRAGILLMQRKFDKARTFAEKSLRDGSHVPATYSMLAAIAAAQGDTVMATKVRAEAAEKFHASIQNGDGNNIRSENKATQ